jgi:hypothetical protein
MAGDGAFDSQALSLMRAALDQAWVALPPEQQTPETRERIAQAVVMLATQWERDQVQPGAVSRAERSNIIRGVP